MTVTDSKVVLGVGAQTERGRREENQDNMSGFSSPFGPVYIVADGMGGHRGGAEASHIVVETFRQCLADPGQQSLEEALCSATSAANAAVLTRGMSGDPSVAGMGSTVVFAVVSNNAEGSELWIGHVGDSRAYLLREGSLRQLTRDHSAVQRLLDADMVTADEARSHPDASVLTRVVGREPSVLLELSGPEPLLPDDIVLLCSDGLSGYVDHNLIQNELQIRRSPSESAQSLISLALERGSDDNITVQVLRTSAPAAAEQALQPESKEFNAPRHSGSSDLEDKSRRLRRAVASHMAVGLIGIALGFGTAWVWQTVRGKGRPTAQSSQGYTVPASGHGGALPDQGGGSAAPAGQHPGRQEGTVSRGGPRPSPSTPRTDPQHTTDENVSQ